MEATTIPVRREIITPAKPILIPEAVLLLAVAQAHPEVVHQYESFKNHSNYFASIDRFF